MTYVKTYLPTLKTHVVNLKRDAKDLSCDLQRLEVRGKLGSKTLYWRCTTMKRRPCWCTIRNALGLELFSHGNAFFCSNKLT